MMPRQRYIYTLICLYLLSEFRVISGDQAACDKSKCKGPIKYYEDVQCIPTYAPGDSCCPVKYNCDHLKGRSVDKCYYKGHVYELNESLREEDAKPCDIGCTCSEGWNSAAQFSCAEVDCFDTPSPGCYMKKDHHECCDGPEVCPGNSTNIPQCIVDGTTYLDGQEFTPKSNSSLSCICSDGYKGENVPPFCKPVETTSSCDVELHNSYDLYNNCTPGFYSSQNPATECNFFSRCQNDADKVIESANTTKSGVPPISDPSLQCYFGNLSMNIGDQLNSGTHYSSVCLRCVCEVPPIPTCKRLPDDECDITVHAKFDDFSK